MPTLVNQENRSSKRSQLSPTLKTLLALLILLVPVLILLGKALFTGKMLNAGDYINQYYPWRHYAATSILRGTFPLWNPYAACGYPFFADAQTAMLYPLNFVYLIFPIGRAILYSVMLHLFLGGAFMYVLVLRLTKGNRLAAIIGALAYMLNGYNSADLEGHVALLNVTCWLPLIFLLHYAAAERMSWKYAAAAGTVMGVTLLAGHLNMFFYIGLAVVFLYIWKGCTAIIHRDPLRLLGLFGLFAMAVLISACLSAPQLLPAFQFAEHSIRYTQWSFRDAVYCSFPIHGFLTFIAPGLFGTSQTYWGSTGNYIETSAYPGIFPLILAAAAVFGRKTKERWYFVALALIGLFLALGGYNPAYRFLCDHLPLLGRFRAPARALLLCSFSLSVLAGLGADKLLSHSLSLKRYAKALIITLLAVYISLIAAVPLTLRYRHQLQSLAHDVIDFEFFELRQMFHPLQYYYNRIDVSTMTTALHRPLIVLPVFIALAILLWRKKINSTVFCILLTLVGIINLVSFGDRFVETTRPEKHFAETKAIRYLKDDRAVYRIATVTGMDRNHGMVHAIQDTQINNPLRLKRYEQIFGLIKSSPDTTDTRKRTMSETALNLLNVKYLMVKNEIENKQFELVKEFTKPGKEGEDSSEEILIYRNKEVIPRAFFVWNICGFPNAKELLEKFADPSYDPRDCVLVVGETASPSPPPTAVEAKVAINHYSANRVSISVETTEPGYLVLSDMWYPEWRASVNGNASEIIPAYLALRAVKVPAGASRVEFWFSTRLLKIGGVAAALCIVIIFGALLLAQRRRD